MYNVKFFCFFSVSRGCNIRGVDFRGVDATCNTYALHHSRF